MFIPGLWLFKLLLKIKINLFFRMSVKSVKFILGLSSLSDSCIATFSPEVSSNFVRVTCHSSVKFTNCHISICPKKLSTLFRTDLFYGSIRRPQYNIEIIVTQIWDNQMNNLLAYFGRPQPMTDCFFLNNKVKIVFHFEAVIQT